MNSIIQSANGWVKRCLRVVWPRATGSSPAPAVPFRFAVLPEFVEWTGEDIMKLRGFLASATGQKLIKVCGSAIHVEAMAESAGDRASKKAHGMDALLRFQFNLASDKEFARATGEQVANPNTAGSDESDALLADYRRSF